MPANLSAFPSPGASDLPSRVQPRSRTRYLGLTTRHPLYAHLETNAFDGGYPTEDFPGVDITVELVTEVPEAAKEDGRGLWVRVINGGGGMTQLAHTGGLQAYLTVGEDARSAVRAMLERGRETDTARELSRVLGSNAHGLLQSLLRPGPVTIGRLDELTGVVRLLNTWNSLTSAASYLYERLDDEGWLTAQPERLLKKVVEALPLTQFAEGLLERARAGVGGAGELLDVQSAVAPLNSMLGHFGYLSGFLPTAVGLTHFLWRQFSDLMAKLPGWVAYIDRLQGAKSAFEQGVIKSFGKEGYAQLLGPRGQELAELSRRSRNLLLGGGSLGVLPFLVGTVYQIVADIGNLIINLLRYTYRAGRGLGRWFFQPDNSPPESVVADASVMELFAFGFNPKTFGGEVAQLITGITQLLQQLLEAFLDNAKEAGEAVGSLLAKGTLAAAGGLMGLLTGDYPVGAGVIDHSMYQIKQWFSIGCVIGPLLLDVVLLFCSGGSSGVFSLAAKAGKLGDAAQLARFATKWPGWLERLNLFKAIAAKIPPRLFARVRRLTNQLWALVGKLSDTITTLLQATNNKLRKSGQAVAPADLEAIGKRFDDLYDAAGAVEIFAALAFFLIGGSDVTVTEAAVVKSSHDGH